MLNYENTKNAGVGHDSLDLVYLRSFSLSRFSILVLHFIINNLKVKKSMFFLNMLLHHFLEHQQS